MPNQPKTPTHNVRVSDDLWRHAQAIARTRDESLSAVIRAALARYVKRHEDKGTP